MFVCKFGQNPLFGSGDKSADKAPFYSLYSVVIYDFHRKESKLFFADIANSEN